MSRRVRAISLLLGSAAALMPGPAAAQLPSPNAVFREDSLGIPPTPAPTAGEARLFGKAGLLGVPPAPAPYDARNPADSEDSTIDFPISETPESDHWDAAPKASSAAGGHPEAYASGSPVTSNAYDDVPSTGRLFAEPLPYNEYLPEPEPPLRWKLFEVFPDSVELPHEPLVKLYSALLGAEHFDPHTELDEYPLGLQPIPERPPLVLEINEYFLAPGWLEQGVEIPTGAVWRPSIWVFGTYRTGVSYLDGHTGNRLAEWAHRLDLFAQVNLTGTERIVAGLRPVDDEIGRRREFNSYDFREGDWIDGWNADIQTLFFEGDFGEIFPWLDPYDSEQIDYGFSVGRMPLLAQQGLFINEDRIDAVTVTRNTLYGPGLLNLRVTGVYAWDEVNRNNNVPDDDAQLFAVLSESDFVFSTVNADAAYVKSSMDDGDLLAFAVSGIQRLHGYHNTYNSSLHFMASYPLDDESPAAGRGQLLFSQFSWTPHHSQDLIYVNGFWAIDQFTSPARGPLAGGPLGQTGVLFSAPGLGRFGAPLSNQASDTAGASVGYQLFYDETRQQVIFEFGGRDDTREDGPGAMGAVGMRYQRALGQHWIFLVDAILSKTEGFDLTPGGRIEFLAKF